MSDNLTVFVELADAWDVQAQDAEPAARRETLRECADALRMMVDFKRQPIAGQAVSAVPASVPSALYVRLSDDGLNIRKWDFTAFEGATEYRAVPDAPVADADGWIRWTGGEPPVGPGQADWMLRSGIIQRAADWRGYVGLCWAHAEEHSEYDIIAYRVVSK